MSVSVRNGTQATHIAMFPWIPFGHVNPFIQLANQLAEQGYTISFLTITDNVPKVKPFVHFPEKISIIPLEIDLAPPLPPPSSGKGIPPSVGGPPPFAGGLPPSAGGPQPFAGGLPPSAGGPPPFAGGPPPSAGGPPPADSNSPGVALFQYLIATDTLESQLETELTKLKPDIVVYEFAHYLPAIAKRLGIKSVYYNVTSASSSAYHLVPACKPATPQDLTHPPPGHPPTNIFLHPFEAQQCLLAFASFGGVKSFYERITTAMEGADLIIMKTSKELEGKYCDYIQEQYKKPLVLAGLALPEPETDALDERWDSWLSKFPTGSVLYCSFGSWDTLSKEQLTELVLGLEESGIPFMAVLKFPGGATKEEIFPEEFLERVKGRGVIHSGWVQQQLLLAHDSVGCYLSHSGFGSLAEGVSNDCQLVLLPLKGDQFLNARLMTRDFKAAVEIERGPMDGKFTKDDVCRAVRSVMVDVDGDVGREVRGNNAKLKASLLDKEIQLGYKEQVLLELERLAKGSGPDHDMGLLMKILQSVVLNEGNSYFPVKSMCKFLNEDRDRFINRRNCTFCLD